MPRSSIVPFFSSSLLYEVGFWDRHQWEYFLHAHKDEQAGQQAAAAIDRGTQKVYSFPRFALEVFHRLYSAYDANPIVALRPEAQWAVNLHEQLGENPDFEYLRSQVTGDHFLSGLAASSFISKLIDKIPEPEQQLQDPQQLRDQVVGMKRTKGSQQQIDKLVEQGKQAVAAMQEFAEQIDDRGLQMQMAISAAATDTQAEVEEAKEEMFAFSWGNEVGQEQNLGNIDEKLKLLKKIAKFNKLKEIAQQAGRLKRIAAKKQKSKSREAKHTIQGVEAGNDLSHLLPSQYLGLAVPAMRPLFAKAYSEKNLLQYQLGGRERLGKGPIVVCIDDSGSMNGRDEVWAKSVCLAMMGVASKQKRHFRIIHFDAIVRRVDDFPQGKLDKNKLLDSMQFYSGGGTSFEEPLDEALNCIKQDKNLRYADIVLITDGECRVNQDWLHEFKRRQKHHDFHVYGIAIGADGCFLKDFCNEVIEIDDIENDDQIAEVFGI